MKMVDARMKIIMDARPRIAIIFLTTCWPANAAMVATKTKYEAATMCQNKISIANSNKFYNC